MIKSIYYRYKLRRLQKRIVELEHFQEQLCQTVEELKSKVLPSMKAREAQLRRLWLSS